MIGPAITTPQNIMINLPSITIQILAPSINHSIQAIHVQILTNLELSPHLLMGFLP